MNRMAKFVAFLLIISINSNAQTFPFSKASYAFWDTAALENTWWRNLTQSMTATIDTVKLQITIPNLQLWANVSTRRNLITGQTTNSGDTTLSTSGTMTLKMIKPILTYNFDGVISRYVNLQDGIYALWTNHYLAITFPRWNKYIRLIEFGEL